jgi:CRISPR-associated protein Cmr3
VLKDEHLFQREARVGLQLQGALRAAEETLLYEAEFVRLCPGVGLMASVTGLDPAAWEARGVLQLGGEQRLGYYRRLESGAAPAPVGKLQGDFCLYLATPTYFDGGWQPQGGDWSSYFTGPTPTLVAAAVGKPLTVGGIDLAASSRRGRNGGITHKPARRLVPAGSIYYFHSAEAVELAHPNSLCSGPDWQIGFGQVLAGQWTRGDADV